ncbi:MAG TPA: hypothetical protein VFC78_08795 [Tepidisphaeraceae bacterium]|nr:hypothetical protein [Tepidisphaeraceae bacterium]
MKAALAAAARAAHRLVFDDGGAEVIEWALIAGLVVIAAVATVAAFGTKVLARWTSVDGSF